MSSESSFKVTAAYSGPIDAFNLEKPIPAPASSSVPDKTQYLGSLRDAISSVQDEINKELTARMEEDKKREAASGNAGTAKGVNEVAEEENYGEEVVEED